MGFARMTSAILATVLLLQWAQITIAAPLVIQPGEQLEALSHTTKLRYSRIVSFGDSFSDAGNGAWTVSNHTWPADKHYVGHRFSNGKVWVEDLASRLGVPLESFATGGATTNNKLVQGYTGNGSTIPVPSVADQVTTYLAKNHNKHSFDNVLFVVEGGGNDAFFGIPNVTGSDSAKELLHSVKRLEARGAKHFLVPTLPPLAPHYPFSVLMPSYAQPLADFSSEFRRTILSGVGKSKGKRQVVVADFWTTYSTVLDDPKAFGFDPSKIDQSCLRGVYMEVPGGVTVCSEPRKYVYWDEYHPTKAMHRIVAKTALEALQCKS